ncbi:MAG: efflux RND transporter periplasmic adaptor subunit [Gammaproteobacteria bacterium]|nr:efflux RND transporter periplasmic adaptor subunit [Gammaproteobacteria bacterium]
MKIPDVRRNLGLLLAIGLLLVTAGAGAEPGRYPAEVVVDPRAIHTVTLRTNARIVDMEDLNPGRRVAAGDTLFTFESAELRTLQKSYLTTHRNLGDIGDITPRVKENVTQNKLALLWRGMSEEDIERIEETAEPLDAVPVKAPVDGVITRVDIRVGQVVNAGVQSGQFAAVGVPVLRIADDRRMLVEARVPPADAVHFRAGMPLVIETRAGRLDGQVEQVLPLADAGVPRQRVVVRPVDRAGLHPGMRVLVRLPGDTPSRPLPASTREDDHAGHHH